MPHLFQRPAFTLLTAIVVATCALWTAGCGSDTGTGAADGTGGATTKADPDPFVAPETANALAAFSTLKEGWNEIQPGAPTVCSRGTIWAFYVNKGDPKKVVIDFEGGGACWNTTTCSVAGAIFNESIDNHLKGQTQGIKTGIYDKENKDNPFYGWTHIYVPYCTGDIHWGNTKHTYGTGTTFDIEHKGAVNARVALGWMHKNMPDASNLFVTGCSAGSYGSIGWAPHVMKAYPDAHVAQMGDCGAGVITDTFLQESFSNWNAAEIMPAWIPELDPAKVKITDLAFSDLYIRIANFYGKRTVSQFNTYYDWNQTFYFEAMGGGDATKWSEKMNASINTITAASPNFRHFTGPDFEHCILHRKEFYTVAANGVKLVDWVRDMSQGKAVSNVMCKDCGQPKPKKTK
jgi:hypothetical protein